MKPVDFLFILTQDLDSPSGLGRYLPLARSLAGLGFQVKVVALHSNFHALKNKHFQIDGVQVDYVAPMHVLKQGSRKSYYGPARLLLVLLNATIRLTLSALRSPARWVVVGKPHPMNSAAGLAAKWLRRSNLLVDCDDFEAGSGNFQNRLQRAVVAFFEKNMPRWADAASTNTHYMGDKLLGWRVDPKKVYYLPNGIDEIRFSRTAPLQEVQARRAALGLEGKKVAGYVGSMSLASHSILLLIDAFERLLARAPGWMLLLVGGGEDFDRVEQEVRDRRIQDSVILCGRVAPEEAPLYYRLAHVSVDPVEDTPAARGRCPVKMFESWACGVPFVTNDVGDRKILAGGEGAALLAQPGDPASLADAIEQALTDAGLAASLIRHGGSRAGQFYWTRLAEGFAAFTAQRAAR